ncbi:MAG TPA: phage portal protein [Novosphingobium sp.]|nr:phage portal protein [Novosphingobium sp.]
MSWIHRLLGRKSGALTLTSLPDYLLGPASKSGVNVTWSTALEVSTMLACCKVMGEGIAQSRCRLMRPRKNGAGLEAAADHPLYRLLYRRPNNWQSAFEFWETLLFHLMLVGNAYVFVNRVGSGRIHELVIIEPSRVVVTQMEDYSLVYDVTGIDHVTRRFPASMIWHIRGASWNGWMGMESVRLAREALGLSIALEAAHAAVHKNGAQPTGIYSIEGSLSDQQHKQLTEWLKKHAAQEKGSPLILDRAAKWVSQQMTGVDAEHVATRRLQIEEVCRAARVIPLMVGQSDKTATYASVEQLLVAHVVHGLAPWASRLEQSGEAALLTEQEDAQGYELTFNLAALMRGDYKSRQEGLQIMRRNGIVNANEWREQENMNPREDPGGAQYIVEANMQIQDGRDLTGAPAAPTGA